MSINMEAAFNFALKHRGQLMDITDIDDSVTDKVLVAPSNFYRNLSSDEEMTVKGREYVISKSSFDESNLAKMKKNLRINDPNTGLRNITEVREMTALNGIVIGYRVRTS